VPVSISRNVSFGTKISISDNVKRHITMSLKDITLGQYVYADSLVHSLDPRTKLACTLIIMTGLFIGNSWLSIVLAGIYVFTAGILSRLPLSYLFRSLLPFKWLIIITFLLNVLFVGGYTVVEAPLPFGGITREGVDSGLIYSARIAILIIAASLLTLTTQPVVLVTGVEKLLAPFSKIGLKPHEIALAMVITIRFIPVFIDEAVKINKSYRARGFNTQKGIAVKLKAVSLLLMPLFASALRRADELAIAMECRLYSGSSVRTRYHDTRMTVRDWITLLVTAVVSYGMVVK
jgi:energy-coupling factor transport system permease protein